MQNIRANVLSIEIFSANNNCKNTAYDPFVLELLKTPPLMRAASRDRVVAPQRGGALRRVQRQKVFKKYRGNNWLVTPKRPKKRCFLILRCRLFLTLRCKKCFARIKLDNAFEIMCTLRLSIDINLMAFRLHLWLKPPVEFVRRKLDNAFEVVCTSPLSRETMLLES